MVPNQYFNASGFFNERHVSEKLLQFFLEPLTRVIYDQNLFPCSPSLHKITDGISSTAFSSTYRRPLTHMMIDMLINMVSVLIRMLLNAFTNMSIAALRPPG